MADVCGSCSDHNSSYQKALALFTLSHYDFYNTFLLKHLINSCVLPYLDDPCPLIRQ
jgi:hypothetical protein